MIQQSYFGLLFEKKKFLNDISLAQHTNIDTSIAFQLIYLAE